MAVAEIVSIGTELLLGELTDTNAGKIALAMRELGIDIYHMSTVGDNVERISRTIKTALNRADIVISTGGLGPTIDDMTRLAVANATGRELEYSTELEGQIARRFEQIGRPMGENNKRQAWIPRGARVLENPVGTAPCFAAEDTHGRGLVVSLPGVPHELEYMLANRVIPLIKQLFSITHITKVRVLRTCGMGESTIDRILDDLLQQQNPTVGLAAHIGQTDVRITAKASSAAQADELIEHTERRIRERLKQCVYGIEKQTLAEVTGELLARSGLTLSIFDTVCQGHIAADLNKAGFGNLLHTTRVYESCSLLFNSSPTRPPNQMSEVPSDESLQAVMRRIREEDSIQLLVFGPLKDNSVRILLSLPDSEITVLHGRLIDDSPRANAWIALQALDLLRRTLTALPCGTDT